jgi:hypothetical protein
MASSVSMRVAASDELDRPRLAVPGDVERPAGHVALPKRLEGVGLELADRDDVLGGSS